ncbi:Asp23/Gls24 family envelope stress response protein [Mycoplasma marinum]|uniref:Asp23/Gls24 family envelope stress response protein n=1 Tax=Mycoplasma marinum TaxID=1937190 RepID=A0A4V2NI98_9MOLU|nr:Asp23/Gls24 family envelope stress response protein [Mycoplasma marinum]TCG12056.1 hypothetical protein C4B24_00425 [Mycoplasma marinum]
MSETKIQVLKEGIINAISTVPGLVGLVNKESEALNPRVLSEKNYTKGIDVVQTTKGIDIKVFIIISLNVRAEIASRELLSAIQSYFKTIEEKILKVNIYIKGVK